ncbi:tetratricopeptide repeat protein [Geobacillus stearothermophilus]|nr:tetratricopeptide repeat protein [Geobacillus stearothermophilus]MED3755136.1 tetratricopeptide repeat protein [Geobacillus stearothermophilus]
MGKQLKQSSRKATIVPFIQNGEYFFKKGMKAYDRGDLHKARKYFERAVRLDERDASFALQLALVLSELGEYQFSNQWLFKIIHDLDETMDDCLYFLANNFACLGLFREARQYAEQYLANEPDGEFADDAADLLELLRLDGSEWTEEEEQLMVLEDRARRLLEEERFAEAIEALEAIVVRYPDVWAAHNNLALAYFYSGDVDKAKQKVREVLKRDPGNLHALCNALVFAYYLHDQEQVSSLCRTLAGLYPFFHEHQYKLGATFALVGRFDLAFRWLHRLYKSGFRGDGPFYFTTGSPAPPTIRGMNRSLGTCGKSFSCFIRKSAARSRGLFRRSTKRLPASSAGLSRKDWLTSCTAYICSAARSKRRKRPCRWRSAACCRPTRACVHSSTRFYLA